MQERTKKVAKQLPINTFLANESLHADLRWEMTSNWAPYSVIRETDRIKGEVEEIGKILVSCEYISESEIKQQIVKD